MGRKKIDYILWAEHLNGEKINLGSVKKENWDYDRILKNELLSEHEAKHKKDPYWRYSVERIDSSDKKEIKKHTAWSEPPTTRRYILLGSHDYEGVKVFFSGFLADCWTHKQIEEKHKAKKGWTFEVMDNRNQPVRYPTDQYEKDPEKFVLGFDAWKADFIQKMEDGKAWVSPHGDDWFQISGEDYPEVEYVDHVVDYKRSTETNSLVFELLDGTRVSAIHTFHHWGEWNQYENIRFQRKIGRKWVQYDPREEVSGPEPKKKKAVKKKTAKKKATKKKTTRKKS